ncbi:helix-turn-helix domain-containing protein [Mucilaginibacter daejeonensis]|uniref:helix-turn-helix domain-containing protein n=1 Tax=Mucilaginibacter daejeonensis TaxID=398049 RepID=UPI001D176A2E|nr:helix-turn-helix domain-containing protein [Mucilaginibacter daejeonensis]UEG53429.1 helix-turn-helix domain-containing protein [Mucilaginibacter daejeonensis]
MALPNFLKLTDQGLQYLDISVYTAFKWHDNPDQDCFPMHETVGKMAGLSKRFVIESVKRLEASGVITVDRSEVKRVSNLYYFAKPHRNTILDKIPKDFFELTSDLTKNERAMLLCLRQFFNHLPYECHESKPCEYFGEWLGISKDTVRKQFSALIAKGYIAERFNIRKCGQKARTYYMLTDKIDWNYEEYEKKEEVIDSTTLKVA